MKSRPCLALLAMLSVASCAAPPPQDGSSYYYPSTRHTPAPQEVGGLTTAKPSAPAPRGSTAMPPGEQYIEQYNESGPFGSYNRSTVIQSSGGVQSYQTIGNMPVYPGQSVPGYMPGQTYQGPRTSQQPVFVPGVGGNPGYYINPGTGARLGP